MYYKNPYNTSADPENWMRWNIGEEDGSREVDPRGHSVAYKDGYNAGRAHAMIARFPTKEDTANARHT